MAVWTASSEFSISFAVTWEGWTAKVRGSLVRDEKEPSNM